MSNSTYVIPRYGSYVPLKEQLVAVNITVITVIGILIIFRLCLRKVLLGKNWKVDDCKA